MPQFARIQTRFVKIGWKLACIGCFLAAYVNTALADNAQATVTLVYRDSLPYQHCVVTAQPGIASISVWGGDSSGNDLPERVIDGPPPDPPFYIDGVPAPWAYKEYDNCVSQVTVDIPISGHPQNHRYHRIYVHQCRDHEQGLIDRIDITSGQPGTYTFDPNYENTATFASAGPDQQIEIASGTGATITLDGSGSFDPDPLDGIVFQWETPAGIALNDPTAVNPSGFFPVGTNVVTLIALDGRGGMDMDEVAITVTSAGNPGPTAVDPVSVTRRGAPAITADQARRSGPGHPWQISIRSMDGGSVNSDSLSKQTEVPLVEWHARGGMPLSFELNHNSQSAHPLCNSALGPKWMHSFDTHLLIWTDAGVPKAALVWGNHTVQLFGKINGQWMPTDGYRDVLTQNGGGYIVTLKSQVHLEFGPAGLLSPGRFRLNRIVDPNGNAITVSHNAQGRVSQVSDPSGRLLVLTYAADKLTKVEFKVGTFSRAWTISYDGLGRIATIVWPQVTTDNGVQVNYNEQFSYDPNNNIMSRKDRAGQIWQAGYNAGAPNEIAFEQWPLNTAVQRVLYTRPAADKTRVTDPVGVICDWVHDANGRLTQVSRANGFVRTLIYGDPDYPWAPSAVTFASGDILRNDYDANGNVVGAIDPAGNRWDFSWDARNNLTQALEPLVTDHNGVPEPARHRADYFYNAQGNLIRAERYASANNFVTTLYNRDAFGQLVSVTNALNRTWNFLRDAHGNLIMTVTPEGRAREWKFENAEATFGFTVPNAAIDGFNERSDLARDEWGRLRVKDLPGAPGQAYAYSYDGENHVLRAGVDGNNTVLTYSANGWLTDVARPAQNIHYNYLPNGLRSALLETGGVAQRTIQYSHTARNELAALSDNGQQTSFLYDADGRLLKKQLANGARAEYAYLLGRLASITHFNAANAPFASFSHTYQENGLPRRVTELDGSMVKYARDFRNLLTREVRTGATPYDFQWTHDAAGNRLTQARGGESFAYAYDDDNLPLSAISALTTRIYLWDANGRLNERHETTGAGDLDYQFHFDFEGRLLEIRKLQSGSWKRHREYAYDGLGRRMARLTFRPQGQPEGGTDFFHDGLAVLREETSDSNGARTALLTWSLGLIAHDDSALGAARWAATDAGGLRRWTNDSGGADAYQVVRNSFGEVVSESGGRPPYGFGADAGWRDDGDAGLIYTGAGWYFPQDHLILCVLANRNVSCNVHPSNCDCRQCQPVPLIPWSGRSGVPCPFPLEPFDLFNPSDPFDPFQPLDPPQPFPKRHRWLVPYCNGTLVDVTEILMLPTDQLIGVPNEYFSTFIQSGAFRQAWEDEMRDRVKNGRQYWGP